MTKPLHSAAIRGACQEAAEKHKTLFGMLKITQGSETEMVKPHKDVPEPTAPPKAFTDTKFPGNREYLSSVTISSGVRYKVYMPNTGDAIDIDMSNKTGMYQLVARCIGISYQELRDWPVNDTAKVADKLAAALVTLDKLRGK